MPLCCHNRIKHGLKERFYAQRVVLRRSFEALVRTQPCSWSFWLNFCCEKKPEWTGIWIGRYTHLAFIGWTISAVRRSLRSWVCDGCRLCLVCLIELHISLRDMELMKLKMWFQTWAFAWSYSVSCPLSMRFIIRLSRVNTDETQLNLRSMYIAA